MAKHKKIKQKSSRTQLLSPNLISNNSTSFSTSTTSNFHYPSKRCFESFPLDLVPDKSSSSSSSSNYYDYDSDNKSRELRELVKGRVWVIPSFFSPKECHAWIDFCESFSDDSNNGGFRYTSHPASSYVTNRECYRMQEKNGRELSHRIFKRLQGMTTEGMSYCGDSNDNNTNNTKQKDTRNINILSQIHQETADLYRNDYKPINCNPNIRIYRYDKGHSFGRHVDESNITTGDGNGICTTEMTMLIYLSTCEGGATKFHLPTNHNDTCNRGCIRSRRGHNNKQRDSSSSSSSIAYSPQIGSLLLHVHGKHCLEHEADTVLSGKKYVLRTDLIYDH